MTKKWNSKNRNTVHFHLRSQLLLVELIMSIRSDEVNYLIYRYLVECGKWLFSANYNRVRAHSIYILT